MGKCTERLYNGIVKENPTFAWYVSDTCGYIISDQRSRYGTFYNLYSGVEQCVYLTAS